MKKILTLLILLCAAYGAFWYYQAEKSRKTVISFLEKAENPGEDGLFLQHGPVKVEGFPFSFEISIHKLRLLKKESSPPFSIQALAWTEGPVLLGTDLLGKSYWMETDAPIYLQAQGSGEQERATLTGKNRLTWEGNSPDVLRSALRPFEEAPEIFHASPETLLKMTKSLAWQAHHFSLAKADAPTRPLAQIDAFDFFISHDEPRPQEHIGELKADIKGMSFTEETLRQSLPFLSERSPSMPLFFHKSKSNLSFAGKADKIKFSEDTLPELSIEIEKLTVSTDLGDKQSLEGDLSIEKREQGKTIVHLDLTSDYKSTPESHRAFVKQFVALLEVNSERQPALQELLRCCRKELEQAIPETYKLGDIRSEIEIDAYFRQKSPREEALTDVELKKFNLLTDRYGFRSHGEIHALETPKGIYKMEILNYQDAVESFILYYNRLIPLLPYLIGIEPHAIKPLNLEKKDLIISLIRSVSDAPEADAKDVSITIDFLEPEKIKIGKKTISEAITTVEQFSQAFYK